MIIGDGHLNKKTLRTSIELTNKRLLEALSKMISNLFGIKTLIKNVKKRVGKKQTYYIAIYSKAIQELLSIVFEIPRGKKSNIVKIPDIILSGNKMIQRSFMIRLLSTEGGRKDNRRIRISSASKRLIGDVYKILSNLSIISYTEKWTYKKYKKEYYGISFKREYLDSLMQGFRSGQTGQILDIFKDILEDQA